MKIIEWFGGIGAASKAVANTLGKENVKIVDYVELDKHACKSYNAIHGTNFVPTDINNVDVSNYPEVDLLIAGWPCQDLSTAGKQAGMVDGTRSNLVYLTIQKINEMKYKPKHILLENVKGLLSKKFEADFKNVLDQFRVMGYNASYEVLNSKYFGIPQSRERVFILLTRVDLPFKDLKPLLEFKTVDKVLRDVLDMDTPTFKISIDEMIGNNKENIVVKDDKLHWVLSDGSTRVLFEIKGENKTVNIPLTKNYTNNVMATLQGFATTIMAGSTRYLVNEMPQYNGKLIKVDFDKLANQDRNEINRVAVLGEFVDAETFEPVSSIAKRHKMGVEGQINTLTTRSDHDNQIIFKEHSFNQKKDFLGTDGVCKTLRAGDCDAENKLVENVGGVLHYRKLTAKECFRLMGFDDTDYANCKKVNVSESQIAKQAGNSIVVNVLQEIIKIIKEQE